MFNQTAQYYDQIYSFKDYTDEANKIKKLIQLNHAGAKTILDVGCGTGEHIKNLSDRYAADGIDIEPQLIEKAKQKNPSSQFTVDDMRSFDLGRQYDVVQCLFSSIGYLTDADEVVQALIQFANHLNPNGIVLVEPWFTPDSWEAGRVYMKSYESENFKICRMSCSEKSGNISKLYFHYLIGDQSGVRYLQEEHSLALYTSEQMKSFFAIAGMDVEYDPIGIFDRGLYIAKMNAA